MRKLVSLLGIGFLAAGCLSPGPSASPVVTAAPTYNVATGSDQLLLSIETGGGLVPMWFRLTHKPWFALYGDGRIIVPGPTGDSPLPLVPDLRQMHVAPAEIQKILAAADPAGLLGPDARFYAVDIFDASTTTFITTVDGKTHTLSAYALGYPASAADASAEAVRVRLADFERKMEDLSAFLGRTVDDTEAYKPAAMRIFTSPFDSSNPEDANRHVVAWPLGVDPGTAGEAAVTPNTRCLLVTEPDLDAFLVVAKGADAQSIWTYGAAKYSVYVRPLYSHEKGCTAT
jgi:hypothetical protein